MMRTANEDFYLARIQEILDGHPSVGSPAFSEYKNEPPLSPPVRYFFSVPVCICETTNGKKDSGRNFRYASV